MPLIAISKTGQRINILNYKYPKKELEKGSLFCQLCGSELMIRHGNIKIQHFAHQSVCTSDYVSHPETIEHLIAKHQISLQIRNTWEEYSESTIELEYAIDSLKRVLDIAMIFKTGWIVGHEIQLSSITTGELDKRTSDYLDEGIDVIWWLGKNASTPANREWCVRKYGACYLLDYERLQSQAAAYRNRNLQF